MFNYFSLSFVCSLQSSVAFVAENRLLSVVVHLELGVEETLFFSDLFSCTSTIHWIVEVAVVFFVIVFGDLWMILTSLFSKLLDKTVTLILEFSQWLRTSLWFLRLASISILWNVVLNMSLIWTRILRCHLIVLIIFFNPSWNIQECLWFKWLLYIWIILNELHFLTRS